MIKDDIILFDDDEEPFYDYNFTPRQLDLFLQRCLKNLALAELEQQEEEGYERGEEPK